jgi:hypothetical protein
LRLSILKSFSIDFIEWTLRVEKGAQATPG